MKTKLFLVLLMVAALGYFLYIYQGPEGTRVGSIAPLFSAAGRSASVKLEDYRGKVVLLNFWATWCPPCVHEMPSLEGLHQRLRGKDFQILAVSVDEGGWEAVDRFLKQLPVTLDILLDARGDVSSLYGTYQLPESYLIDKSGVIVQKYVGPRDWMDPSIIMEIEKYAEGS